jgi:hypothetical protein
MEHFARYTRESRSCFPRCGKLHEHTSRGGLALDIHRHTSLARQLSVLLSCRPFCHSCKLVLRFDTSQDPDVEVQLAASEVGHGDGAAGKTQYGLSPVRRSL